MLDKHFYLLDLKRGRYEYPRLRENAIALAERFKPNAVLIEDASTGVALAQELRGVLPYPVKPIPVESDKRRLYVQQDNSRLVVCVFPRGIVPAGA